MFLQTEHLPFAVTVRSFGADLASLLGALAGQVDGRVAVEDELIVVRARD